MRKIIYLLVLLILLAACKHRKVVKVEDEFQQVSEKSFVLHPTLMAAIKEFSVNAHYGQTNEKYKENSRKSVTADRKPISYDRVSNFGARNEMCIYLDYAVI